MNDGPAGASAFVPASPRIRAAELNGGSVHLWWLPCPRAAGREPLKAMLAAYLGLRVDAIGLVDDVRGRPHLASAHGLDFNWSHSGGHAVVALARDLPALGVDIESIRARPRALELARRFFAPTESAWLERQSADAREAAFLRLWTAKEAVLKAHGYGIAYGLARVAFAADASRAWPVRFEGDIGAIDAWQCHGLALAPGFIGMVAWRGAPRRLACYTPEAAR